LGLQGNGTQVIEAKKYIGAYMRKYKFEPLRQKLSKFWCAFTEKL